jgi:iron complex outermembrane receptor protein
VQSNIASGLLSNGRLLLVRLLGSRRLESEELLAYEAGYRWQATSRLSFDLAGFYNVFDDVTSAQLGHVDLETNPPPPHLLLPVIINNANAQRSFGAEGSVNLSLASWWKLSAAETWQQVSQVSSISRSSVGRQFSLETSHQMFNVRSTLFLPRNLELNVASYYVSRLVEQQVPSYTRLDVRLGWRASQQLELSVGGQNLLQDHHTEYGPVLGLLPTEVRRNAYARATWRF